MVYGLGHLWKLGLKGALGKPYAKGLTVDSSGAQV